ncbi:MAG: cell division protein FtsL [Gammaproteobacteria bacterium]|nr:cell division protein FtsL [Gammaproteobacteria bacterium]MDH3506692.1 cell division protein FtsL [Gammaproteobacteria bacterium]
MTFGRYELLVCVLLAAAVVTSAVWVASTRHQARQLFIELEALNRERDRLQVDWGRLQLEQSAWAAHPRVESLAREDIGLDLPDQRNVVLVTEQPR